MKYIYWAVAIIIVLVVTFATVKKVSPASWGWWGTTNVSSGVSLKGHDAVAYFETASPVPGDEQFSYEWADASWHFASQENRDKFAASPEQFAPRFGGFCAFAMSKGFTADSSPDAWHMEDGRLFIFADKNVRDDWVDDLPNGSLAASEESWKKR